MRLKRLLFALVTVLIFFALVEGALWIGGVVPLAAERDNFQGFSSRVRVFERNDAGDRWATSPRAVRHSFNPQSFLADKPANGLRIFTLGGSSAYGFPWGARVAFTNVLAQALAASRSDRAIEAVNAAAMSYGSHRLRILAHELARHEPDILIIYEGHNEFVERRFYRDLLDRPAPLDGMRRLLHRWRLFSAATRLRERWGRSARPDALDADPTQRSAAELLGIDVVREYSQEVDEAEKAQVRDLFAENLAAIVEIGRAAGATVILCTAPSNLEGWAPNQSFFPPDMPAETRARAELALSEGQAALERGDAPAAAASLELARELAPTHAEIHFRLGQAYERVERWDEARQAFIAARDLDGKPSRALGSFNAAVRRLAAEHGALLVDIERAFEEASPHGIPGFNLFEDYVHPKPEGHRLIALELWRGIERQGLAGPARDPDAAEFWAAVGEPEDSLHAASADAPAAEAEARTAPLLFNLGVVLENQGRFEEALERYTACLELAPNYHAARVNRARLLVRIGRIDEAEAEYRRVLAVEPSRMTALVGLGDVLRRQQRPVEAAEVLLHATRVDPKSAPAWDGLGGARVQLQLYAEAEAAFRQAALLDPRNADVRANLGFALLFQGRGADAGAAFRDGLTLRADHARCRNGWAAVLTEQGQYDEAERLLKESLRLDPNDAFAKGGLEILAAKRGGV